MTGAAHERLRTLGNDAGGCTHACSEMHTFSWPCEQSMIEWPPRWRVVTRMVWRKFCRWTVASPWPAFIAGGLTWMLIGRLIGAW